MIREIKYEPPLPYGRYFLSMEAPGDATEVPVDDEDAVEVPADNEDATEVPLDNEDAVEVPVDDGGDAEEVPIEEPPKRNNTKVIDVKPNNRARLDFTDGAEEPDEATEVPIDDTNGDATEVPIDGDAGDAQEVPVDDTNGDATEVPIDGDPVTDLANNNGDAGDAQEVPVDGDATEVSTDADNPDMVDADGDGQPDTDAGEDFTGGEGDAQEVPADAGGEGEQPDQKKGPGLEYDSTRKYSLFLNYQSMLNAITNYITKLESNMNDDPNENYILKTATEKLRMIKELAMDYMMMKFEISSYVQSLLFFQNIVVMVQMVFDILNKMQKKKKNKTEKTKH